VGEFDADPARDEIAVVTNSTFSTIGGRIFGKLARVYAFDADRGLSLPQPIGTPPVGGEGGSMQLAVADFDAGRPVPGIPEDPEPLDFLVVGELKVTDAATARGFFSVMLNVSAGKLR